nr:hypothetical protein [Tanacetum cinerariifolium]
MTGSRVQSQEHKHLEASSKAKVQVYGSKAKVQTSRSKAKQDLWSEDTPNYDLCKREEREEKDYSSNTSDNKKGPSIGSVPKKGPSIQGLLDWYGYDTIEEYLYGTYFLSTDKDITDKDSTDEDTIHESYSPMSKGKYVPVSQKHNLKVKIPIPIIECVLGLANVTTDRYVFLDRGVDGMKKEFWKVVWDSGFMCLMIRVNGLETRIYNTANWIPKVGNGSAINVYIG